MVSASGSLSPPRRLTQDPPAGFDLSVDGGGNDPAIEVTPIPRGVRIALEEGESLFCQATSNPLPTKS